MDGTREVPEAERARGAATQPRVGVSACLLGARVRYDGADKRSAAVADELSRHFELVSVCPEFEAGLGVPRPALQLVADGAQTRLLEIASGRDHSERMQRYANDRVRALTELDLCGYVLKRNSPSCGLAGVAVAQPGSAPRFDGRGLFAIELLRAMPDLPVVEEGDLEDPAARARFVERVAAYRQRRGEAR